MTISTELRIAVGFGLGVVLLLVLGTASFMSARQLVRDVERESRTRAVVTDIERVTHFTLQSESSARGYMLTGDEVFLEPYDASHSALKKSVAHLRALTAGNTAQQARVGELIPLIARRLTLLHEAIDIRRQRGLESAAAELRRNRSKATMDAIREVATAMRDEEIGLLRTRATESRLWMRLTPTVVALGSAIAFAFGVIATLVIRRDLAARVQAEKAVRASEERFRDIVESAADATLVVDASGRIVLVNRETELLFGYARDELLGKSIDMLVPQRSRGQHYADRAGYMREPRRAMGAGRELLALRRDGSKIAVEVSLSPLGGGSQPMVTVVVRDITERRRADEVVRHAREKAEEASRAKSEFLANMSHEIRTPMNGVIGMTDLALHTDLPEAARRHLGMVKTSAGALLTVINGILDFSRIEAGKLDLDRIEFALRNTLRETVKSVALQAHAKGLELVCSIAPDVPDALVGDADRLRQIVVNLVANAIKFTARGEVAVRMGVEAILESEVVLHAAVSDTGVGIPSAKQQAIFDAFEQADTSTVRRYGGTGLGLTISAELVRLMGGRIWVVSALGQGSTFHFTARLGVRHDAAAASAWSVPSLEGISALVVDDNATNRASLVEMLESWRMQPVAVTDGAAAVDATLAAQVAGRPFSLVLVDAQMPGMDGFALARRIRDEHGLACGMIMMLNADHRSGDVHRCRELGIAGCLTKPVTQSELLDAIRGALGGPAAMGHDRREPDAAPRPSRPLRILLAEDNVINQALIIELVAPQGHAVVVASNGQEAVAAVQRGRFDVIFMDVQMPDMDGFAATRAVRAYERETGARTPIVAMTAHAMKGDEERCVAAGMDAYVSKPIDPKKLFAVLERIGAGEAPPSDGSPIDNPAEVLERLACSHDALQRIVGIFADGCPRLLRDLRTAAATGNAKNVEQCAHLLRGSVVNFGGAKAGELAERIEARARSGDLTGTEDALALLEAEIGRLIPALVVFADEGGMPSAVAGAKA